MTDNINNKKIGNRKFVLELRYDPILSFLDKKGTVVESLLKDKTFSGWQWEIGQGDVRLRDAGNPEDSKNFVSISFNKLNIISSQIDSVESFYSKYSKLRSIVFCIIGQPNVTRIGSRIIGTYYVASVNYSQLLDKFLSRFPGDFLIQPYVKKDFLFHLDYENGMYEIGPLNTIDSMYEREFKNNYCVKHVGIAIDTDNYLTNEARNINDESLVKNVYALSLSVEKDLFDHLKEL